MKICYKCGIPKDEEEFFKDRTKKDGLHPQCKVCHKRYYKNNAEKIKEQIKEYRKNNAEKIKEQMREYHKNNAEKIKEQMREWYKNNIKKRRKYQREYMKEYRKQNKGKIREREREYDKKYREQYKEKKREYEKEYRNSSAPYNIYAYQISYADEVRQDPDNEKFLQVKCTYCKEWYNPTTISVHNRIQVLEGRGYGEGRLYCSDRCKKLCPTHSQQKYPKGQKPYYSRADQKDWAEMVKERDGYKCIKCGETEGLTAHHKEGIRWNPLESADVDIGVTLCEECNKKAHSIEGRNTYDMRCNNESA